MKSRLVQAKYRRKKGCGCKLCKPHKGGHDILPYDWCVIEYWNQSLTHTMKYSHDAFTRWNRVFFDGGYPCTHIPWIGEE